MPTDRLIGPRSKIERAKHHIRDLDAQIQAFFGANPNPYVIGTKRNPQTRQLIYYLVSVQDTPAPIAATAGDVLQNLRSALDHLAYQLVLVGTGQPGPFYYVYFPIFAATEYEAKKLGQIKGMRKDAIDALDATKTVQGWE